MQTESYTKPFFPEKLCGKTIRFKAILVEEPFIIKLGEITAHHKCYSRGMLYIGRKDLVTYKADCKSNEFSMCYPEINALIENKIYKDGNGCVYELLD
jgi:hypothetical protein